MSQGYYLLHYFYWNQVPYRAGGLVIFHISSILCPIFERGILLSIPFLPTDRKERFADLALKDTENVEISGVKDSAILCRGDVNDNSLAQLDPLSQTELGQFDHKILTKHQGQSTIFGASNDTNSGDTNILSDETIKPPNVTISQLSFVEEDRYGSIMKIFNFEVAYITEPNEKIEFKTNDFTKVSPDTNLKSRENEMEVFKCDPCIKSKTRKDKSDRVLDTSFAMCLIFLLSKPVFIQHTSHASSM